MALDFSVGNAEHQKNLEWVAPPPPPAAPAQGRDTHALFFELTQSVGFSEMSYEGLMFFRPRQLGAGPVGSLPGLDGVGTLRATKAGCTRLLDSNPGSSTPEVDFGTYVRVFIGFRPRSSQPALVFATLRFLSQLLNPETQVGEIVEVTPTSATDIIQLNEWELRLRRTTVLLRAP